MFDLALLTMNEQEAQGVSEAIFERTITGGGLEEFHDIVTGIDMDTQIPFIGNMGLVGSKITSCDRNVNGVTIPLTEKFWRPVIIGDRLKHCAVDTPALFKLFKRASKMNPDFYDKIGTEEFGLIIAKADQAIVKMINRLVWFGDTAAANVSAAGEITNGTDVKFFNPIDGLFKQIFAEIPTTAANYVEITANAGVTKAAQATLAADAAFVMFRAMYNKIDARFFQALEEGAQPQFLVTRALFQNFQDYIEDTSKVFTLAEIKDGVSVASYRNIPIKVRNDWDNNIRTYQDNGTIYNLPHRALLTVKENIPVGTLATSDLSTFDSWYEKKDKANYVDFDLKMDVKHLLDYMTVAAY